LDANSATFPPVLAIGPFVELCRALVLDGVRREADPLLRREDVDLPPFEDVRLEEDELVRLVLARALPDEPAFLLVDLFVLEPLDELLLEDRVVCAIVLASLGFLAGALFAPTVNLDYPLR
jgi:hypothetical protein